jgi:transcriptional regulator with XRE-family HTH domain
MVDSGFTRKKVESLTLGEKLRKLRNDSRTSLQEVSKMTRIQVKYLEYLENGEYGKLPADVYVRGFLRSYARYLNIDEQTFIRLYERERNIQQNLGRDPGPAHARKDIAISSIVVTPRAVVIVLIACMVSGAFFYLYREFRSFTAAPYLMITEPAANSTVASGDIVVRGRTDRGARLSINGQSVFVGDDGSFAEPLLLQPGLNMVSVVSVNRFDKERTETIAIEAEYVPVPADPSSGETVVSGDAFFVDISVEGEAASISVRADGVAVFSGQIRPGEMKHIEGKEKIEITSDHGERTFVMDASGKRQALSVTSGLAKDKAFFPVEKQGE